MNSRCSGMTTSAGLLLLAAALLPAATLRAEVSLVPARNAVEARVEVRSTPTGPWSARDLPTERTLNPFGDLLGDGFPGTAGRDDWACAAWVRPTEGQVLLAIGGDEGWGPALALPAEGAIGSPRTATLADGAVLLGWTSRTPGGGMSARFALTQPDGSSVLDALDGPSLVLGGSELGPQAAMLALVDRGSRSFELVLASPIKPPNEPPLFRLQTLAWLDGRGGSLSDVSSAAAPLIQAVTDEEEVFGVVSWRSDEDGLSYVLLGREAELSEARTLPRPLGNSASPRAILRQVLIAEGLQGKH